MSENLIYVIFQFFLFNKYTDISKVRSKTPRLYMQQCPPMRQKKRKWKMSKIYFITLKF